MDIRFKVSSALLYVVSVIFIFFGFDKIHNYENPEDTFADPVNAYVGGDAYNYIINANYAAAYFTLATLFAVVATLLIVAGLIHALKQEHHSQEHHTKGEEA